MVREFVDHLLFHFTRFDPRVDAGESDDEDRPDELELRECFFGREQHRGEDRLQARLDRPADVVCERRVVREVEVGRDVDQEARDAGDCLERSEDARLVHRKNVKLPGEIDNRQQNDDGNRGVVLHQDVRVAVEEADHPLRDDRVERDEEGRQNAIDRSAHGDV